MPAKTRKISNASYALSLDPWAGTDFLTAQERYEEAYAEVEYQIEMAAERYYEDRGYWAARAQEDYEMRMGITSYL